MQKWSTVDTALMPDGSALVLARRGDEWVVRVDGHVLMGSRAHDSEGALAELALARATRPQTVLVGGLGLGFTLRAVLDRLPSTATVVVAELSPELVGWNQCHLGPLANSPLDDPRTSVVVEDVLATIERAVAAFDVIVLDVDNGPQAVAHAPNRRIYAAAGIAAAHRALRPGGVLAVWSAGPSDDYERRLRRAGFAVESPRVTARRGGRSKHIVFVAQRGGGA